MSTSTTNDAPSKALTSPKTMTELQDEQTHMAYLTQINTGLLLGIRNIKVNLLLAKTSGELMSSTLKTLHDELLGMLSLIEES